MSKVIIALVFSGIFCLQIPQNIVTQDVTKTVIEEGLPYGDQGWLPGMNLPRKVNYDYYIQINFIFKLEEVTQYPVIFDAFLHAISIWESYLPIEADYFLDAQFPFWINEGNFVHIELKDLAEEYYDGLLGLFVNKKPFKILIDDLLEEDRLFAVCVAMHELGHFFGLPHVIGREDKVSTKRMGSIIVPGTAIKYLMFSHKNAENKYVWKPSPVEVAVAANFVRNILGSTLK